MSSTHGQVGTVAVQGKMQTVTTVTLPRLEHKWPRGQVVPRGFSAVCGVCMRPLRAERTHRPADLAELGTH